MIKEITIITQDQLDSFRANLTEAQNQAVDILRIIWKGIDWSKVKGTRMMTISSEFEGQATIRARQHSNLTEFINALSKRMNSQPDAQIVSLLHDDELVLNAIRSEIKIIMAMLQLLKERANADYLEWKMDNDNTKNLKARAKTVKNQDQSLREVMQNQNNQNTLI